MKLDKKTMQLYLVTDKSWLEGNTIEHQVEEAIKAGVTFVQLRNKELCSGDLAQEGKKIKKVTDKYKIPFVVNDNIEVALEIEADGVHVGQSDMKASDVRSIIGQDKILGVSVHSVEQALLAQQQGADYIGVGAVFSTDTKLDARPMDKKTIRQICEAVNIPVVAIGGINESNIMELSGLHLDGIAVISAILAKKDIGEASKKMLTMSKKMTASVKKVLTIAGSDCSGGAGIQADIKTITAHGMYAMSVVTALTAQNTTGVSAVMEATPEFVGQQLDAIFTDIYPDAVKIGMVSNRDIIEVIVEKLKYYKAKNIVVDPVMISTSGSKLLNDDAMEAVITKLIPLADIITPNIPEAEALSCVTIKSMDDMLKASEIIAMLLDGSVLVKGGHLEDAADDLIVIEKNPTWIKGKRIENPNTHGTGCTLSSAIACNLAQGFAIAESVINAKGYITGALLAGLDIGKGSGPLNHCFRLNL